MNIKRYGWKPQRPDIRDYKLVHETAAANTAPLPESVDLRSTINWVYDQGNEGSCTAQSTTSLFRFTLKKDELPEFLPSRNFLYYNTRVMEGDPTQDAGGQIRDVMTVLNKTGVCDEKSWDYNAQTLYAKPPQALYTTAMDHRTNVYLSVTQDRAHLQACLAAGYPFVFGFTVFASFEGEDIAKTGNMPWPDFKNEQVVGAHAICCVGYDNKKGTYTILNSWGKDWGDKGYFYMPYEYAEANQLCDDFWTIRTFQSEPVKVVQHDVVDGSVVKSSLDWKDLIS